MKNLNNLWHKLSHVGVDKTNEHELREIVLCNKIVLVGIILVIGFLPIEIILNGFQLVPVEIISMLVFATVLVLNYKKRYTIAKYYIIILSTLMIALMTFMVGGGSNSEYMLLSILIAPLMLFNNIKHIIILILFVAVSFFIIKHYSVKFPPIIYVEDSVKKNVQPIMMIMCMILLIFEMYYFKKLNLSYQHLLIENKKEIELKQKEIIDSIHYAKRIQEALLTPQSYIERNLNRLKKYMI